MASIARLRRRPVAVITASVFCFTTISIPASFAQDTQPDPQKIYQTVSDAIDRLDAVLEVIDRHIDRSVFEIDALAAKLGNDPAAMFRFVRDEIRYEPYFGVLRGPRGALIGRAANSLDRALLLAALLDEAGFNAEIVGGSLDDAQATRLVGRIFEPALPAPQVLPDVEATLAEAIQESGLDAQEMLKIAEAREADGRAADEEMQARFKTESAYLEKLLSDAGITLGHQDDRVDAVAAAKEHYWVRYEAGDGWLDLDSSFPDSEVGSTYAAPTEHFAPSSPPHDRIHRISVAVTLRVAQNGANGEAGVVDTVLTEASIPAANLMGRGLSVANVPQPEPTLDLSNPDPQAALATTTEFVTVIVAGGQVVGTRSFDLRGHVFNGLPGTDAGNAERAAETVGGGFGGAGSVLDQLGGNLGGGQALSAEQGIIAQWIDYRVSSPGPRGEAMRETAFHRDIFDAETATTWTYNGVAKVDTIRSLRTADELRLLLKYLVSIAVATGPMSMDYLGYLVLNQGRTYVSNAQPLIRKMLNLPSDQTTITQEESVSLEAFGVLAAHQHYVSLLSQSMAPELASVVSSVNMVASEDRFIERDTRIVAVHDIDIICLEDSLVSKDTSDSGSAPRERMRSGVLATAIEYQSGRSSQISPTAAPNQQLGNVLPLFERVRAAAIAAVVLTPDASGLQALSELQLNAAAKARIASRLMVGAVIVTVSNALDFGAEAEIGWWELDPGTGRTLGYMLSGRGAAEYTTLEKIAISSFVSANTFILCLLGLDTTKKYKETASGAEIGVCLVSSIGAGVGAYPGLPGLGSAFVAFITAILDTAILLGAATRKRSLPAQPLPAAPR